MATENDLNQYYQHAMNAMEKAYHAMTRDGTVPALAREAMKDIRAEIHQFFFGRGERSGEPGAPLNPLHSDIAAARNAHGSVYGDGLGGATGIDPAPDPPISPGQIAQLAEDHRGGVHGRGDSGLQGPERGVYGPEHGVYGRGVSPAEKPGPLLSPGEIAGDRNLDGPPPGRGSVHGQGLTPGQIAADQSVDGPLGRGIEVAQVDLPPKPGGWVERELERERAKQEGNADQDGLSRGRVLPDEQMERNKGRDR
jgi:hypothetical protein